jgi:hypothetical protein
VLAPYLGLELALAPLTTWASTTASCRPGSLLEAVDLEGNTSNKSQSMHPLWVQEGTAFAVAA